jgi:hypothetical protein
VFIVLVIIRNEGVRTLSLNSIWQFIQKLKSVGVDDEIVNGVFRCKV